MYLIVGLGNPGSQYEVTYHNVGFTVVNEISKYWGFQNFSKKSDYLIASGMIHSHKVLLLKPYSFMNNSGIPVAKISNFYKILHNNIIVIHDDADLPIGKIKVKKGGSSAGHNGIKSIDSFIGNDYWRIRFGIGRPEDNRSLSHYVLSKFENPNKIAHLVETIVQNIHLVMNESGLIIWDSFINKQQDI
ncbi:aminoacyl-tRNA hydrolase [Wolbachia pipientis]|uniref:Peptidyl-tRNA hydrolase n=1 Tax=Wolbachia pipientis TaxID=955 RepID=A0A1E7QJV0_WOLPI|nr:aminoacyl-tRNA hydrolase [Wolbachia pipientis]OEY86755.1 aminoacyl-tRNA hydrolase [Wolbachia pipientis]